MKKQPAMNEKPARRLMRAARDAFDLAVLDATHRGCGVIKINSDGIAERVAPRDFWAAKRKRGENDAEK